MFGFGDVDLKYKPQGWGLTVYLYDLFLLHDCSFKFPAAYLFAQMLVSD